MKERIEHIGTVQAVGESKVKVKILQSAACGSCEARKLCQSSESKEKIIDAATDGQTLEVGQRVMVYGSMSMGRDAVVAAFVLPLALIVGWMFASIRLWQLSELLAIGGMALILALYYLLLYAMRGRLSRRFVFHVDRNCKLK